MHVVFTKTSAGEDWVCKKVGKPICNELFTKQPYLSSTMYHPEELAIYCAARIAFHAGRVGGGARMWNQLFYYLIFPQQQPLARATP